MQNVRARRRHARNAGFSLMEIMVVLAIIGALASAVGIAVIKHLRESRIRDTKIRARTIQNAVTNYMMGETGDCPTVTELLAAGDLDSTKEVTDAWGNDFTIECDPTAIHVRSTGPDEQAGTDDDVGF